MGHAPSKTRANGAGASAIDAKAVRELAKILNDTGLTEIEVEKGELRIRVAKELGRDVVYTGAPAAAPVGAPPAASHSSPPETPARRDAADVAAHPGAVTSPMVGTVYLASDPDSAPFVKVGDSVNQGDTLLLIEAMKTFNPIPAPKAGKVLEIIVQDAQPVEFGETLVIIG
ncbi:MAG: acetyl-CoA carboxylase biotin carboxyl carrier protein [Maricaulaceae bacterium]|jgi:acetyl-CoA carboxylase biotin carboxyl carrier protein